MFENILVLTVILLAIAFILWKISKAFSGNGITCGCCSEKGCAGCRDSGSPHSRACESPIDNGSDN